MTKAAELEYRMSGLGSRTKPLVYVELRNGHALGQGVLVPAIMDSGADLTCVPKDWADTLGHEFEAGLESSVRGVGGSAGARGHTMILRLIGPSANAGSVGRADIIRYEWTFPSVVLPSLKHFVLLGCHDFLKHWEFRLQTGKERFSLAPKSAEIESAVYKWRYADG